MALKLKVLTLNCWGVPYNSQHRRERMNAIASELSKGEYDIAVLQEIWCQSDYDKLCMHVLPVMPYSHYFHSGMIGSGVCIFSKHVVHETFHHRFRLNGHAHKLFQSDWFGGKAICMAKICANDVRINVYGTHLHAQYHEDDDNEAHRAVQSFELSQFVQHTSEGCDMVVLTGDFNFRPDQLGYKVIRYCSNLDDAWETRREKIKLEPDDEETTCDRPDNPYTKPHHLAVRPKGIRLDYIMYRPNGGTDVTCEKCYLTMQNIPNTSYHYSDHEGVAAVFSIRRNPTAIGRKRDSAEVEKSLSDTLQVVERGVKKVKSCRVFYLVAVPLCVAALVFMSTIDVPHGGLDALVGAGRLAVFLYAAFCVYGAIVGSSVELNGLVAARKDINNALRCSAAWS